MELLVSRRTHVLTLEILYVFDEVEQAQRLGGDQVHLSLVASVSANII